MKLFLAIAAALLFGATASGQNPQLFHQRNNEMKNMSDILKVKTGTSSITMTGKNLIRNFNGEIKILPQDNMPCLATTINSKMQISDGLSGKNFSPVPIPNIYKRGETKPVTSTP